MESQRAGVDTNECRGDIEKHGLHITDAHVRITESITESIAARPAGTRCHHRERDPEQPIARQFKLRHYRTCCSIVLPSISLLL